MNSNNRSRNELSFDYDQLTASLIGINLNIKFIENKRSPFCSKDMEW